MLRPHPGEPCLGNGKLRTYQATFHAVLKDTLASVESLRNPTWIIHI